MLTESCVMFFSPSRAALSAILRDEYLTSGVRTKEGFLVLKQAKTCLPPSMLSSSTIVHVNRQV